MMEAATSSLDYASYPHVVDRIVSYADDSCLPALRATCRGLHLATARRMYSHVVVRVSNQPVEKREQGFVVKLFAPSTSEPASRRVPGLRWPEPAIEHLQSHLDVIDLEDARLVRSGRWSKKAPDAVEHFNLAARARVIRRWDQTYEYNTSAGDPFRWDDNGNQNQVLITFADFTVSPPVRDAVSGVPGAVRLSPEGNHMPDINIRSRFGPRPRVIINVRYDPRQPDLRDGRLDLVYDDSCSEVVLIFTPTDLWTGPSIPKPTSRHYWLSPDPPMGWLCGLMTRAMSQVQRKAYNDIYRQERSPGTRFVFVGAEVLDGSWVDSAALPFGNPVTNSDLAAGFATAVEKAWLERGLIISDQQKVSPEERVRCLTEMLVERGGWDGLFRFVTLDEWRAEVDARLFDLATIPPAKPLYVPDKEAGMRIDRGWN
ncbi:uncharacterized protein LOC62_04G005395 [Vanrija pseudolonga]|uniref:Uncharacterized protein n=1 Tax=Vanrija pseudolonga TaxID=143232 RepID=A0AAF0YDM1_9TREE|nr:hypothetical protein LOC62_04G005395 [Vanrija pseudolonga]